MSQAVAATGDLVRVSIVGEDRRLDVGLPALVPLVELIPGFARTLGVLDPTLAHAGYLLRRADGAALDPSLSSIAQGVHDGELLTLVSGALMAEPRIYDDVVEAVIDASADQHRTWTPQDNARTALALSLTFLALCGVLLVSAGQSIGAGAFIAAGGGVVLLATAIVLNRLGQLEAGNAFGLAAAAFAGLTGFLAVPISVPEASTAQLADAIVPAGELWGWPMAAAGLGTLIVGAVAFLVIRPQPELHLIPTVFGLVIGLTGLITALLPGDGVGAFAVMVAVSAMVANGLPWLALSSTRIRVISPQSDVDVFAAPAPIDAADVRRRAVSGQRVLTSLRIALGLTILLATIVVAADTQTGALLCGLAFIGMMFHSRQILARSGVLVVMAMGGVGLAVTGLTVSVAHPDLRPLLLVLLLVVTGVLVTVSLLSPRARLRLGRVADTVEVIALAVLLPLGVISAGLA